MNIAILTAVLCAFIPVMYARVLDDIDDSIDGDWYLESCNDGGSVPHYKMTVEYTKKGSRKQLKWSTESGDGKVTGKIIQSKRGDKSRCKVAAEASGMVDSTAQKYVVAKCGKINLVKRDGDKVIVQTGQDSCSYVREKPSAGLMDTVGGIL